MNKYVMQNNIESMRFQRNIFALMTLMLIAVLILLSCFLFVKKERIVVVPPVVEKAFWVEGKDVSSTYLEQFGVFIGGLLLGNTSSSAKMQQTVLLRHVTPEFSLELKEKLLEEEKQLKKQNGSYTFFLIRADIDMAKKEVVLEGDRVFYLGGKLIFQKREKYALMFSQSGGRLLLNGVKCCDVS